MSCFRLEKYSRYNMSSKLRGVLGDVENKMDVAVAGGSEKSIAARLQQLAQPMTKGRRSLCYKFLSSTIFYKKNREIEQVVNISLIRYIKVALSRVHNIFHNSKNQTKHMTLHDPMTKYTLFLKYQLHR